MQCRCIHSLPGFTMFLIATPCEHQQSVAALAEAAARERGGGPTVGRDCQGLNRLGPSQLLKSAPAVSQICSLHFLPSMSAILTLKSILRRWRRCGHTGSHAGSNLGRSVSADGEPRALPALGRSTGQRGPHPIVVMKLLVNWSSENRNSRQLFPTPGARRE